MIHFKVTRYCAFV